jgi:hypothetical protein
MRYEQEGDAAVARLSEGPRPLPTSREGGAGQERLGAAVHLVKPIQGDRFQVGNNRGRVNGRVFSGCIYGRCVMVE